MHQLQNGMFTQHHNCALHSNRNKQTIVLTQYMLDLNGASGLIVKLEQEVTSYSPQATSALPAKAIWPAWSLAWEAKTSAQLAYLQIGNGRATYLGWQSPCVTWQIGQEALLHRI